MIRREIFYYLLGIIFFVSGTMKAYSIYDFSAEVALYGDYYVAAWVVKWRMPIAISVCIVEIVTGLLALCHSLTIPISYAYMFMLSLFLYLTGRNYLFPPTEGSVESCGCFGELIHFSPRGAFYKSLALWGISLLNIMLVVKNNNSQTT